MTTNPNRHDEAFHDTMAQYDDSPQGPRFDLIPRDSQDDLGPLTGYAVYIVCETWDEVLSRATAWGHCITYRAKSGRWVLKTINYEPTPDEDYFSWPAPVSTLP